MHHSEARAREVLKRLDVANPVGAEVGVWHGEMSAHLLRLRPDLFLYLVDNWLPGVAQPVRYAASGDDKATQGAKAMDDARTAAARRVSFAKYRSRILYAASVDAAPMVPDALLDFVFIDAEHTYDAVRADIAAWLPKLKPGALLSGHDYSPPGERSAKGWPGVVQAVDEFVEAFGLTLDRGTEATWFVRLP